MGGTAGSEGRSKELEEAMRFDAMKRELDESIKLKVETLVISEMSKDDGLTLWLQPTNSEERYDIRAVTDSQVREAQAELDRVRSAYRQYETAKSQGESALTDDERKRLYRLREQIPTSFRSHPTTTGDVMPRTCSICDRALEEGKCFSCLDYRYAHSPHAKFSEPDTESFPAIIAGMRAWQPVRR
jgi:hypothetical protein